MKNTLLEKIIKKTATVGVVGLGYVGLPLSVALGKAGYKTTGIDIQPNRVEMVNEAKSYINDVDDAD